MLPEPGYYWPPGALRDDDNNDIEALMRCFAEIGYQECDNGDLEIGYEKIAYTQSRRAIGSTRRFSRIMVNGAANWETVTMLSIILLIVLRGRLYGKVMCYMRRKIVGIAREKSETKETKK